jgi:hypothetical protein
MITVITNSLVIPEKIKIFGQKIYKINIYAYDNVTVITKKYRWSP